MYRRPTKKKELIKRIATYAAMTLAVLFIVAGLVFMILGYRIDTNNGRIEQGALLQFATIPSGAVVTIDGQTLSAKTPTKSSILAGSHTFTMKREGYEPWQKTLDIKAGTLTWLNYARLIPQVRTPQAVASYPSLFASLATSDGKTMLIQQSASVPSFQIVDLRSDTIKTTTITIPSSAYKGASSIDVTHNFTVTSWDTGGRYVLVQHSYADQKEWLVLDTRDAAATKNVTDLLDLRISSLAFSGTSGNILYALSEGDIRKLDLSAATISRSFVTNVTHFGLFETNIITYVGTDPSDATKRIVGLYREGDNAPHVLRSTSSSLDTPLHIVTTRSFNQDYVAIAEGVKVDIFSGSYPASASEDTSSLALFDSFIYTGNVSRLSFSPEGDYLLVQSGTNFASFDIEHQRFTAYVLETGTTTNPSLKWLDDDHTWSDYGGSLVMREFDGANEVAIVPSVSGQAVALTSNDRYIYSLGKADEGYQLQRVRLVLP